MLSVVRRLLRVATSSPARSDAAGDGGLLSLILVGAVLGEIVLCGIIIARIACEKTPIAPTCYQGIPGFFVSFCEVELEDNNERPGVKTSPRLGFGFRIRQPNPQPTRCSADRHQSMPRELRIEECCARCHIYCLVNAQVLTSVSWWLPVLHSPTTLRPRPLE